MKNISAPKKIILITLSVILLILGLDFIFDLTSDDLIFVIPLILVILTIIVYYIIDEEENPLL